MPALLHIAVVEGSPQVRHAIEHLVAAAGHAVVESTASLAELAGLRPDHLDLVIADFRAVCCGPGRAALHTLRHRYPHLRVIVTTANEGPEYDRAATGEAPDGLVPKTKLALLLPAALEELVGSNRVPAR